MSLKVILSLFKSSSFKFALLTGFTIWLTTSAVLMLVYFKLENTIWRNIDQVMDEQASSLVAQVSSQPDADLDSLIARFNQLSQANVATNVPNDSMMAMHNSPEMQAMHQAMGLANPPRHMLDNTQMLTSQQGQLLFTRNVQLPNGQTLTLTQNVEYLNQLQTSLWQSLIFGLSITLLIAVVGAVLLTQRSLQRIHEINRACLTITNGNFNHRIPYKHPQDRFDDYDKMASVINRMLDEINELFDKLKHVSDNIAHDLKSPLARLRAQLELANHDLNSTNLDDGIAEVDRLLAMIKSLLGIARIESHDKSTFEEVLMPTVLEDLMEIYRPSFEDKGIVLQGQFEAGLIRADRHLLFQAFANITENALKFTPVSGNVSLVGRCTDNQMYEVTVHDSGPGINAHNSIRVFERFYREDQARNTHGFGLGLSLVKAVIQLHGGSVELKNEAGLKVTVTLPMNVS